MENKHTEKREELRRELWPNEIPFEIPRGTGGWFMAYRTLPLILRLIREKSVAGGKRTGDAANVYLELLSRHMGGGIVELGHEADHAYAAGYSSGRLVRSWKERMDALERAGFIKIERVGPRYKRALIVHPTVAVHRLRVGGKVPNEWWNTFRTRQLDTTEPQFERLQPTKKAKPVLLPVKMGKGEKKKVG